MFHVSPDVSAAVKLTMAVAVSPPDELPCSLASFAPAIVLITFAAIITIITGLAIVGCKSSCDPSDQRSSSGTKDSA